MTKTETLQQVFAEQEERESLLRWRHPGFDVVYNWIVVLTVIAMAIAAFLWYTDIRARRQGEDMVATAQAAWQAEQEAATQAEAEAQKQIRLSQEYVIDQEATALAKMFYGIRNFQEKYGYSETDFETYARCAFNRAEASGDLISVIFAKDQFIACDENNTVIDEYKRMAVKFVTEWHNETTKPVDVSYQFAELTPDGIWLKNDFHADGYARRWRAS